MSANDERACAFIYIRLPRNNTAGSRCHGCYSRNNYCNRNRCYSCNSCTRRDIDTWSTGPCSILNSTERFPEETITGGRREILIFFFHSLPHLLMQRPGESRVQKTAATHAWNDPFDDPYTSLARAQTNRRAAEAVLKGCCDGVLSTEKGIGFV